MRIAPNPKTLICKAGFALVCALLLPGAAPAADKFQSCVESLWPSAKAKGVSRNTFDKAFAGLTFDPEVIEQANYQPEYVKPIGEYIDRVVSDKRVATGKQMLIDNKALLDTLEARYGVDRHIIVAIWGVELELRHAARRQERYPVARHAHLLGNQGELRPAPAHNRAQDPPAWRYQRRGDERLVGRRYGPYPVHSDHLFGLCS